MTTTISKQISKNIKKYRALSGLTQVEIAKLANMNSNYYSKIERGDISPSVDALIRIIKVLKVDYTDILP